jgi:hypothetical protein
LSETHLFKLFQVTKPEPFWFDRIYHIMYTRITEVLGTSCTNMNIGASIWEEGRNQIGHMHSYEFRVSLEKYCQTYHRFCCSKIVSLYFRVTWKILSWSPQYLLAFPLIMLSCRGPVSMIHPNISPAKKTPTWLYDCIYYYKHYLLFILENYTTISILIYKQYNYTRTNSKYLKVNNCSVFSNTFVLLIHWQTKYQHDLITSAMFHVLTTWSIVNIVQCFIWRKTNANPLSHDHQVRPNKSRSL